MLKLYDKTYTTKYGTFDTLIEAFVEEERNGLFELSFIILNTDNLFNYVKEENIVVANANDTLLNQKFRIYMTRKLMNNRVEVFARHISFDLMYDYVDNLSFNNQSCEYALNQLFINSNFSKHYKGYSDIVNAQNYKMSMANILEAIGGKKGSIIDTFGTGAEILRDNENIHILNRRGNDNEVTIEYRKNLTGFELEEDSTDLVTRILPYAKYNDNEASKEVTVKANFVDSPLINNYSHPYIKAIDYSEKFDDEEVPTKEKLISLAEKEYRDNKIDRLKQNFKIDFIPLSKCVGYEGLEDKISICDTVTIIDTRYNINTKAKVIRTVFNILKNRYESIELGEPRTTLGDIIGSGGNNEPVVGPPGPQGPPGEDGNLGDFPDSLPAIPILNSFVYGFSNIELTWSFENKIYYQYELYASKIKDFNPNSFDLIFQGQASSYMFQAKPNETWYFKVCAINTYGKRTNFSNQAVVTTKKIEDLSNYVQDMAIGEALIGKLSLDRGWVGKLNANLLDVKGNFSVTDGNGKRTMDIDSFGNITIDAKGIKMDGKTLELGQYVTITDLKTGGSTVINGSNITTGTVSGDRVSGGTIEGSLLQTYEGDNSKGVRIARESMQLNNTSFFYKTNDEFRIQSQERFSVGSMDNIYLMAGLNSNGTQNGTGEVVIPNATLRTQVLSVANNADIYGNLAVSGSVSANSFKVGNNLVYHAGNKPTPGAIGALPTSGGTINGDLIVNGGLYSVGLRTDSVAWWGINSGTIYAGANIWMNGYSFGGQSDRRLKENINYIDRVKNETNLKDNFYNDFKNKFKFATYNYKKEDQKDRTHFGFIAQDLENTALSNYVLMKAKDENNEDVLGYDIQALINVYGSILQKEIEIRDNQIKNLENRLSMLEELLQEGGK